MPDDIRKNEGAMEIGHLHALLAQVREFGFAHVTPAAFPGLDAYVPSYVSAGTVVERKPDGQLEPNIKRD
jgi:hypothetical protein